MKIEVNNLEKVFRTDSVETIALNNVSFTVADGDFAAIMGPSGCGKSTLLNILGLLDNPTGGSYMLDGREVANLRENERTAFRKGKIGFVFQSFNLIDEMTVRDNIMLPLNNLDLPKAERIKRVEQAMQPLFTTGNPEERSGLGFAVMQSFMDRVKVTSKPGKGTRVLLVKRLSRREPT